MAVVGLQRVDGLLNLVRAHLPRRVESSGDFEDWEVVAPALIAIAADLFEGMKRGSSPRGSTTSTGSGSRQDGDAARRVVTLQRGSEPSAKSFGNLSSRSMTFTWFA